MRSAHGTCSNSSRSSPMHDSSEETGPRWGGQVGWIHLPRRSSEHGSEPYRRRRKRRRRRRGDRQDEGGGYKTDRGEAGTPSKGAWHPGNLSRPAGRGKGSTLILDLGV